MTAPKEKACLIVIDGWGISDQEDPAGDAIRNAQTPVMSGFEKKYPFTQLEAHGHAVGLPEGLMGNSEVGHLNIGAGRIVYQVCCRFAEGGLSSVLAGCGWNTLTSERLIGHCED